MLSRYPCLLSNIKHQCILVTSQLSGWIERWAYICDLLENWRQHRQLTYNDCLLSFITRLGVERHTMNNYNGLLLILAVQEQETKQSIFML